MERDIKKCRFPEFECGTPRGGSLNRFLHRPCGRPVYTNLCMRRCTHVPAPSRCLVRSASSIVLAHTTVTGPCIQRTEIEILFDRFKGAIITITVGRYYSRPRLPVLLARYIFSGRASRSCTRPTDPYVYRIFRCVHTKLCPSK